MIPGSYTEPVCVLDQTLAEICEQYTGSATCPTFVEFLSQIGWFDGTCPCSRHLFGSRASVLRCLGSDGEPYDLVYACGGSFEEPGVDEFAVFDATGAWVAHGWYYWARFSPPCCGGQGYPQRLVVGRQVVVDCGEDFVRSWSPSDFSDTGGGYPDTGGPACSDSDSGSDSADSGP